jgi:cytochrome c
MTRGTVWSLVTLTAALVAPAAGAFGAEDGPCDAVRGKAKFESKCGLCHASAPDAPHGAGPNLSGLQGRRSGTADGFKFSPAMSKAEIVWTAETLDGFLRDPQAAVPGTVMAFAGLRSAEDRRSIRCFLIPASDR